MTTDETIESVRGEWIDWIDVELFGAEPAGFCEFCSPDKPGCIVCLPSVAE